MFDDELAEWQRQPLDVEGCAICPWMNHARRCPTCTMAICLACWPRHRAEPHRQGELL